MPQIKMLVAGGVSGLTYDKVNVILLPVALPQTQAQPMEMQEVYGIWVYRGSAEAVRLLLAASAGMLALLLGLAGQIIWISRHRLTRRPSAEGKTGATVTDAGQGGSIETFVSGPGRMGRPGTGRSAIFARPACRDDTPLAGLAAPGRAGFALSRRSSRVPEYRTSLHQSISALAGAVRRRNKTSRDGPARYGTPGGFARWCWVLTLLRCQ